MLILDDPTTWPSEIRSRLQNSEIAKVVMQHRYIDDLLKHVEIRKAVCEIEQCVENSSLTAFHCTKQLEDRPFSDSGLRVLQFTEHHARFLDYVRSRKLLPESTYKRLEMGLEEWCKEHTGRREGMLWVCVDRSLVFHYGALPFFDYFGGEAIYFPFREDQEIGTFLKKLGTPVVVEVRISSKESTVFKENAFARTLFSHYAHSLNPRFYVESIEGYLTKEIGPMDIIAVHSYESFVAQFRSSAALDYEIED